MSIETSVLSEEDASVEPAGRQVVVSAGNAAGEAPRNWVRTHSGAVILLAIALVSIFVLARLASSPDLLAGIRTSLDQQQATVTGLAAGATALSAGLSLVPQEALAPLAEQLADVSGWFVVIISSIVLQKILVTVSGVVAFGFIVPLACALGIVYVYSRRVGFRSLAIRLAAFGLVLCFAVPASIGISSALTTTYADVTAAAASAEEAKEQAEEAAAAAAAAEAAAKAAEGDGDDGFLDAIGDWFSDAATNVGNAIGGALNSLNDIKDDAVSALNSYMEQFALLVVTTCIMPILVMLLLGWVIKMLFSIDLAVGTLGRTVQAKASGGVKSVGRRTKKLVSKRK